MVRLHDFVSVSLAVCLMLDVDGCGGSLCPNGV